MCLFICWTGVVGEGEVAVYVFSTLSIMCRPNGWSPSHPPPLLRYQQADCADPIRNAYEQMAGGPWDIPRSSLVLTTQLLGNGHFGQVKKGFVRMRGAKVPVAIKSLKGEKLSTAPRCTPSHSQAQSKFTTI